MKQTNNNNQLENIPADSQATRQPKGKLRGWILFVLSILVFILSITVSLLLISRSADVDPLPEGQGNKNLKYSVVSDQLPDDSYLNRYTEPLGKHNSSIITVLFVSVDEDESNTMILASVNKETKEVALLSFPRDTYVSGNYEEPRLRNVYFEAEQKGRGLQALTEKSREMLGFWPDYYVVLDETMLSQIFDITGDIQFTIPDSPQYTDLPAGDTHIDSHSAMKLFSCRSSYSVVEVASADTQRELLIAILHALFLQKEEVSYNLESFAAAINTDLSADELGYLLFFLQGIDESQILSFTLPGEIIELEDSKDYFQVDKEKAIEILNQHFNPMATALTVYDTNFRQLAGDSGEGEWEEYGWDHDNDNSGGHATTDEDEDPTTKPSTQDTDPDPTVDPTAPTISELP